MVRGSAVVYLTPMSDIFQQTLHLALPAVGIAFRDSAPPGVPHALAEPASCSYWKRAAGGETFWTDAADHMGCPVGAHTHGVQMSDAKKQELMGLVGTMVQLGYLLQSPRLWNAVVFTMGAAQTRQLARAGVGKRP